MESNEIAVFCGLDVGKSEDHAAALNSAGDRLHDNKLPNTEAGLCDLFTTLARHGPVLVVVDQPASIGALPVAVAHFLGCWIAYLPGLTMRRLADLHPGESKIGVRDAFVIAEAARSLSHILRAIDTDDETVAELTMLTGFDDDLAAESTRLRNRIRGLLTQAHPSLERILGRRLDHPAVLALLEAFPVPSAMAAGHDELLSIITPHAPRLAERLVTEVLAAFGEQTVVVAGTTAAATILPHLAASLWSVLEQRDAVAAQVEHLLADHPLSAVGDLRSPASRSPTAACILVEIGDAGGFRSATHLASYAGLAPATRRFGSSIRGQSPSQRGNKKLTRVLYLSAFASLRDPRSQAYYQQKRAEGKHHVAALTCLARRRVDALFAILCDHTFYQPATPSPA